MFALALYVLETLLSNTGQSQPNTDPEFGHPEAPGCRKLILNLDPGQAKPRISCQCEPAPSPSAWLSASRCHLSVYSGREDSCCVCVRARVTPRVMFRHVRWWCTGPRSLIRENQNSGAKSLTWGSLYAPSDKDTKWERKKPHLLCQLSVRLFVCVSPSHTRRRSKPRHAGPELYLTDSAAKKVHISLLIQVTYDGAW